MHRQHQQICAGGQERRVERNVKRVSIAGSEGGVVVEKEGGSVGNKVGVMLKMIQRDKGGVEGRESCSQVIESLDERSVLL